MPLAEIYPLVTARSLGRAFTYEVADEVERGDVVSIRLGSRADARRLIADMGRHLRVHWKGWRVAALLPDRDLARHFGPAVRLRPLRHGGLELTLVLGEIH